MIRNYLSWLVSVDLAGILAVSQNSLNILKGGVVTLDGLVISTVEEPLSLISNDDPGYETVRQVRSGIGARDKLDVHRRKISINESSSEHDPNYETLLPNATTQAKVPVKPRAQSRRFGDDEEDDGYSKITPGTSAGGGGGKNVTDHDGYSSIRNIPQTSSSVNDEEDEPGYSKIGGTAKANTSHGYASIDEAKKDQLEGYSTIAVGVVPGMMTKSISGTTTNSTLSPISPIGYFPAPSADSSSFSSNTSPSSEFSSSDVAAGRLQMEGNNYESLTSDDPNYETVRNLRITENPYELLENEVATPSAAVAGRKSEEDGETIDDKDCVTVSRTEGEVKVSPCDSPEVGDYFQV